ncbi:MAG: TraR/DksA C4-type zinc finger protein [Chloroflexota bacterium]|nr:TraR/DksA C4-type zinc finger protein [Chloroflexota bacterium]
MPKTYTELHQDLQAGEKNLSHQLGSIESRVLEDGVGYSNHMADAGSEVFEQGRNVGLLRQLKHSYEDTQRALQKFEDGTYGICESCGAIINTPRLEAKPAARYCITCASRLEGRR